MSMGVLQKLMQNKARTSALSKRQTEFAAQNTIASGGVAS
jgi:hypothetical protein